MRSAFICIVVGLAAPAHAHIKLLTPTPTVVTDAFGNPQKVAPCGGAGTASNQVTTVVAGSQLRVQWTDTVPHPGHYRISIAPNRNQFVDPPHVVMNNDCKSATVQSPVVSPTLVDGLFPHTTGATGMMRETFVTVPSTPCADCTLQLLQFMSVHTPPCFYYQCAALRIVAADAGVDAGADAGRLDAGSAADAGVGQTDAGPDGGDGLDSGVDPDAGIGGTRDAGPGVVEPPVGCGCHSSTPALAMLLAAALGRVLRRRDDR